MPTIAERLSDYIVGLRYEDIPAPVVEDAKELLVHHLGSAMCGYETRNGQRAVRLGLELSGSEGPCTIVGRRHRVQLLEAVFANAALIGPGSDYLTPPGILPGAIVQPVAWAVAEAAGASGQEQLVAIVVGYDVMSKLHSGVLPYEIAMPRPLKHGVEAFGAAATTARLLGLTSQETMYALGHAGQAAMGLFEATQSERAVLPPLAARNGVMAALLARAGIPASPTIVEGRYGLYRSYFGQDVPESVLDGIATLGRKFAISQTRTKQHSVSALNQLAIDLSQELITRHALKPQQLRRIDVILPKQRKTREVIYGDYPEGPKNLAALVLATGHFDAARLDEPPDAALRIVRDTVHLSFEGDHPLFYTRIEATTREGKRYIAESDKPAAPRRDWQRWLAKCAHGLLHIDQVGRLVDLVRNLEDVSDVAEVMACIVPRDD